jgi:lipoprotein-anchoring transpeptidase ErfK/SrfK
MKARSLTSRIVMVLAATLMLTLSATLAWAVANDYRSRGIVPEGVSIAGQDLGGMTEAQARDAIDAAVSTPMLRTVTVAGDGKTWALDPTGIVSIDTVSMLNEAYSTRRSATLVNRIESELRGTPLPNDVKPVYSVDKRAISKWVSKTAKEIDRDAVDASRTVVGHKFVITPEILGAKVKKGTAVGLIEKALGADAALDGSSRVVTLPINSEEPTVTQADFNTALIVSLANCRIYLYHGAKRVKTYRCAPGRPGFPTPMGDFYIQSKQRYAAWYNPGTPWAKSMPKMIPGGPGNPMGTTKIGINYTGVFMHGVPPGEYSSIGTHASHGCMRMMPADVLDLYGRVNIGDAVYIRQ